jgi:hypothetical protein
MPLGIVNVKIRSRVVQHLHPLNRVAILPHGTLYNQWGRGGRAPQDFDFDSISVFRDGNVTRYPF